MLRHLLVGALALGAATAVTGCATIIKGTSQDISVDSNPGGAQVTVTQNSGVEVFKGATPAKLSLSKKHEYTVSVKLAGYQEARVPVTQHLSGWFFGNLLCGGLLGMVIDAVDGAMYNLEPENVSVTLVQVAPGTAQPPPPPAQQPEAPPSGAKIDVQGGEKAKPVLYAVFYAKDADGQLRSMAVPMIPEKKN